MADIQVKNKKQSNELRVCPAGMMMAGQKHEVLYPSSFLTDLLPNREEESGDKKLIL